MLAQALLVAAELIVRAAVRHGALRPSPSMYSLIQGNVDRLRDRPYDVWLLGNSTLAFGLDERAFAELTGSSAISMPHGSATPRALAALADYYLARAARPPQTIVIFATEADFNANGYRARASRGYFDYVAGRRWQPLDHVMLYAARESLVRRLLRAVPARFRVESTDAGDEDDEGNQSGGPGATNPIPRFAGRPITSHNPFHDALVQRYRFDAGAFDLLSKVARDHGVPHAAVVVVPVTDVHRQFFDAKLPNLPTDRVRRIAADEAAKRGVTFIDTSVTVQGNDNFADDYHMNHDGRAIYTETFAAIYNERVTTAPPLSPAVAERDVAGKPVGKGKSRKSRGAGAAP
jgi:hypothetical protein